MFSQLLQYDVVSRPLVYRLDPKVKGIHPTTRVKEEMILKIENIKTDRSQVRKTKTILVELNRNPWWGLGNYFLSHPDR